jgi:acyl carrier protein
VRRHGRPGERDQVAHHREPVAPLFGEGLGLDSIDALEIAMEIRKRYGVKPTADEARNREIFSSVRSLAGYVALQRETKAG